MKSILHTIILATLIGIHSIGNATGILDNSSTFSFIQNLQQSLSRSKIYYSINALHPLGIKVSSDQNLNRIESAIPLLQYYARELQASNLPSYYAFIPLVESMNRVDALSPKGALGVWQLMPETALNFGAKVNSQLDERQSIILSTRYALRFLKTLENQLEHPIYVLAAYNWGLASVNKVKSSLLYPEQLLTSPLVPQETREYVTAILGYWDTVVRIQDSHRLMRYPNVDYLAPIVVNQYPFVDVETNLMALLNYPSYNGSDRLIPSEHFYTFFNGAKTRSSTSSPTLTSQTIASKGLAKVASLKTPSPSNAYFIKALDKAEQCNTYEEEVAYQIYVVNQDETIQHIAQKLSLSTSDLMQYIPKGKVLPGNVLLIPEHNPMKRC